MLAEIIRVDWEQVRFRRAVSGVLAMGIAMGFLGVFGSLATTTAIATLFTIASSSDGSMRDRLPSLVRFVALGSVLGGLAFWSFENSIGAALVLGGAAYLGTLAAANGPAAGRAGLFLTLWTLMALLLGSQGEAPLEVAGAFAVGGALGIGLTALRLWLTDEDEADDHEVPGDAPVDPGSTAWSRTVAAARSPIGVFAVGRGLAVLVAVLLGFWLFPENRLWIAITVIVVLRPSTDQTLSTAVQRTLGTAIGVVLATGLAQVIPQTDIGVGIAVVASAFAMVAFLNANYTLFAAALTAMIVFVQRLIDGNPIEVGGDRLLSTLIGAAMSYGLLVVLLRAVQPDPEQP